MTHFVFVGGCERSGTTVVAREVARALGGKAVPEALFLVRALTRPNDDLAQTIADDWRSMTWPWSPNDLREVMVQCRGLAPAELLERMAFRLFGEGSEVIVDSSPWNLRYRHVLERAFPTALFVHVVRDGRSVYASVKHLDWGPRMPVAAALWWQSRVLPGVLQEQAPNVHRLRFEDLVRDPDGSLGALKHWASANGVSSRGQGAGTAMLGRYTKDQHRLVHKSLDPARIEAWKKEVSWAEITRFEREAGATLRELGYEVDGTDPPLSRMVRVTDAAADALWQASIGGVRRGRRVLGLMAASRYRSMGTTSKSVRSRSEGSPS